MGEKINFLSHFTIFGVLLTVEDVVLGHGVVLFRHQSGLHLVLNLLDGNTVENSYTA